MILMSTERRRLLALATSPRHHTLGHSANSSLSSSFNAGTAMIAGTAAVQPARTVEVVAEQMQLTGFQTYIVEQWVPDRQRVFSTVTVYTGDKRHQISVAAVRIDPDPVSQSQQEGGAVGGSGSAPLSAPDKFSRLMEQFEEDKARPFSTPSGTIMVTSLAAVSSQLNIILVADGDHEVAAPMFHLNLNLRRLGCSGRSALGISPPNIVQRQRFIQLYKTVDTIDLGVAVLELVRLTQSSLCVLGYLAATSCDGVFCDDTAAAIRLFTEDFGPFETETQAAMGDPTVFAAIVSKIVAFRIMLHTLGHQCPKNPFDDMDGFIAALTAFQKSARIEITGYMDAKTMERLTDVYQRVAPTAGKITKHGHVRVEDLQTLDLESLAKCVNLDVFRQIWGGARRQLTGDVILESANFAEGIIQGSKEIGKNFLRNVSNKKPRLPEFNKDRGHIVIKGLKEGVAGSISRFSNSVEGFVDRRRHVRRGSVDRQFRDLIMATGTGEQRMDRKLIDDDQLSSGSESGDDEMFLMPSLQTVVKSYSDSELHRHRDGDSRLPARRYTVSNRPQDDVDIVMVDGDAVDPAEAEDLWKHQLEMIGVIDNIKSISREYAHKLQTLSEIYVHHWQGFSSIENELNSMMDEFNSVQTRVESLDRKVAKQQYDVAALTDKWKETSEILDNFDASVTALDKQVQQGLKAASSYDLTSILMRIYVTVAGWFVTR